MRPTLIKTPYNYDNDQNSRDAATHSMQDTYPSRTQQQFKDETDINTIVRRFGLTGELPQNVRPPVSGDFTGIMDFQDALNAVIAAERSFMELPGALRARFANDPQLLMDFVADPNNYDEARKLGLLKPPEPQAPPVRVTVQPPATPPAGATP